jgi:hypothetical protein
MQVRRWALIITAAVAVSVAAVAAWAAGPPGGAAPKPLVGRYQVKFTVDEFRKAPLARLLPNEDFVEELVILNALPGSPQGIGLHDLDGGSPTIPFGVKGNVINLSCIGENERPTRARSRVIAGSSRASCSRW